MLIPVGEETANAAATARADASARATLLGWARRTVDLIPTPWLITGAGAVLLTTTAAFGGLATTPAEPIPQLAVGDTFEGSDFEMTVVGVELRDERGNALVFPDEEKGERVLVVTLDVVNTFPKPRPSMSVSLNLWSIDGVAVEGIDGPPTLSRADDGSGAPRLQPDVSVRVLAAWIVGPDDFHDDQELTLTLPDSTHRVGKSIVSGDYWDDVRVGAVVTATLTEAVAP